MLLMGLFENEEDIKYQLLYLLGVKCTYVIHFIEDMLTVTSEKIRNVLLLKMWVPKTNV